VTSAKVSTFGSAVVDAFYVRGPDGEKVTDPQLIAALEQAIGANVDAALPDSADSAHSDDLGS
jgi:UTP:GlnB (protein PII) uridylyltransferase